jgi:hypothetical protein
LAGAAAPAWAAQASAMAAKARLGVIVIRCLVAIVFSAILQAARSRRNCENHQAKE